MSHQNRNPVLNAGLNAIRAVLADAAGRRDGTASVVCDAAIKILCEMRKHLKDEQTARRAEFAAIYEDGLRIRFFATIHDQYARKEIDWEGYRAALESARNHYDHLMAQIAAAQG